MVYYNCLLRGHLNESNVWFNDFGECTVKTSILVALNPHLPEEICTFSVVGVISLAMTNTLKYIKMSCCFVQT